jgi:hypothetical protein
MTNADILWPYPETVTSPFCARPVSYVHGVEPDGTLRQVSLLHAHLDEGLTGPVVHQLILQLRVDLHVVVCKNWDRQDGDTEAQQSRLIQDIEKEVLRFHFNN